MFVCSHCFLSCCWAPLEKSLASFSWHPFFTYLYTLMRSPLSLVFSRLNSSSALSLSSYGMFLCRICLRGSLLDRQIGGHIDVYHKRSQKKSSCGQYQKMCLLHCVAHWHLVPLIEFQLATMKQKINNSKMVHQPFELWCRAEKYVA